MKKVTTRWRVWAVPNWFDTEIFQACCRAIEASDERFKPIPSSKTTVVFRFVWQEKEYYLKHYLFKGWRKRLRLGAKIARLPQIAKQLNREGFSTPEIVCVAHKGQQMFSISVAAIAKSNINELYTKNGAGIVSNMAHFRERFGQEIGRLHAAGFIHGDLRWGNILVNNPNSDRPEFIYLDNDRTRRYSWHVALLLFDFFANSCFRHNQIKNLVQIHFPEKLHHHSSANWDQFWKGYCAENPMIQRRESYWENRVERKSLQRINQWIKKPSHRPPPEKNKTP